MSLFIDTWGWFCLADPGEPAHRRAAQLLQELKRERRTIVTSDYVLDEMITGLFSQRPFQPAANFLNGILQSAAHRDLIVVPVTEPRFAEAVQLRFKFEDKPRISFTDLTSMVIMKEMEITEVLTADRHFLHVGMGFRAVPA